MPSAGFQRYSPFAMKFKRVPGHGPQPARVVLIGEKPGQDEARRGRPFCGPSGQILDTYLTAANVARDSVFVTNCVMEFTGYSKPTKEELDRDLPDLMTEIIAADPEVVGLVGAYAVEHVLKLRAGGADLDRTHGVPVHVPSLFGDQLPRAQGWTCIPLYHPANVIHAPDMAPMVLDDFLRLGQLVDGEMQVREDAIGDQTEYIVVDAKWLRRNLPDVCPLVGIDTEGWVKKPWSLQFSIRAGQGLLIRATDTEALEVFVAWLRRVRPLISLQNSLHDLGVMREMGVDLVAEELPWVDTMIWAYILCCEPQGLKPLAYRHANMYQDSYDDVIGDVGHDIAMEYLYQVASEEWPEPEPIILEEGGGTRVKKPQGVNKLVMRILNDIASGKTLKDGSTTDPRDRWKKLTPESKAPVILKLGDMREPDLDDIDFKRAKDYACRDADCQYRITEPLASRIKLMELEKISEIDHAVLPMIDRMQYVGIQLAAPSFWDDIINRCEKQMSQAKWKIFKATGRDLNPASGDQVADLLYTPKKDGGLGLIAPKLTDSKDRGSVSAICLEALLGENPVVEYFMEYNEALKIKSTYCLPLRKLCQEGDGRVRSTFRTTRTTTGRLSMADPPLHQIPIMTDLGREIRGGFIAKPGHILGDWDTSQIEMRMMAHDSRDPELCRLFEQERDIHTETACKIFSISESILNHDENGKVDDVRRTVAKHAAFGIINGITEHGLVNYMILNRCKRPDGETWTLDDCVMLLREWFHIYGGVKRFQQDCIAETRATGLARETVGGRIIYLPQVWSDNKKVRETAERMSYVMHTQAGAQSLIKKAMAVIWHEVCRIPELLTEPLLQMHDELLFELPDKEDIKVTVDLTVRHAFENTVKLRIPVRCSGGFGSNWLQAH